MYHGLYCMVFANKIAKLQYLVQTAYNDPIHDFPPLILPERQGPERAVHPVAPHVLPLPQPERLPPPRRRGRRGEIRRAQTRLRGRSDTQGED